MLSATKLLLTIFLILTSSWCAAGNFTANVVTKEGSKKVMGKLWVKGNKVRQDLSFGTEKRISIARGDKNITWVLNPKKKTYAQVKGVLTGWPEDKDLTRIAERKDLGVEMLSGYSCKKRTYKFKNEKAGIMTLWVSEKLAWPLRMEVKQPDGKTMLLVCENIIEKKQSDSLFDLPKGYKRAQKATLSEPDSSPAKK